MFVKKKLFGNRDAETSATQCNRSPVTYIYNDLETSASSAKTVDSPPSFLISSKSQLSAEAEPPVKPDRPKLRLSIPPPPLAAATQFAFPDLADVKPLCKPGFDPLNNFKIQKLKKWLKLHKDTLRQISTDKLYSRVVGVVFLPAFKIVVVYNNRDSLIMSSFALPLCTHIPHVLKRSPFVYVSGLDDLGVKN